MAPVVEGISQGVGNGGAPGVELFPRIRISRAEALGDSIGPHGPPFIVVALKPDFKNVCEPPVSCDVQRRKVAVVIDDRQVRRHLMVEAPCRGALEQKVVVKEFHELRRVSRTFALRFERLSRLMRKH